MNESKQKALRKACKEEKDLSTKMRLLAVNHVCIYNMSVQDTADRLVQCPSWVSKWVQRYKEAGIDGLRDLPRSGRPPIIPHNEMDSIMKDAKNQETTPVLLQQRLASEKGVTFHLSYSNTQK